MAGAGWYYVDAARGRHGPLDAAAIRQRYDAGDLQRHSLVWREGLAQWQPLDQVADELGIRLPATAVAPPAPPSMPASNSASPPGEFAAPSEPSPASTDTALAHAYAARSAAASTDTPIEPHDVVDAGFLRRLAALMIDGVLLLVATYAIAFTVLIVVGAGLGGVMTMFEANARGEPPSGPFLVAFIVGFYVLPFAMRWAYFALFTASGWQATPGKRAVGIKVVDLDGKRLGVSRATGRWFAAALSYLTFYIGFLMAAFTDRKQALHDLVASTRVVDQWAYTAHPERQQRGLGGCAIAALVGIGLFFVVAIVGVIAAVSLPAYQEYTERSTVAGVVAEGRSMSAELESFVLNTDRCPSSLDEAGLAAPSIARVARVGVGELDAGRCTLEFTLDDADGSTGLAGEYLWFSRSDDGTWACNSTLPDTRLPADCRG